MELTTMNKIISSLDSAGITVYDAVTDTPAHFYQNDKCFNVIDKTEETIYNFAPRIGIVEPFDAPIIVKASNLSDVHEIRFGGTIQQIKKFVEAYGIVLNKEQLKLLVNINGANYNLKPVTGDYLTFEELSEDDLSKLTSEEKTIYEATKKEFERKYSPKSPVQVTV